MVSLQAAACDYSPIRRVSAFLRPGDITGLLAAAFLSINVPHFLLSQAARPYSLQTALFLAAFLFIARLLCSKMDNGHRYRISMPRLLDEDDAGTAVCQYFMQ
jgi:hypothetical protein